MNTYRFIKKNTIDDLYKNGSLFGLYISAINLLKEREALLDAWIRTLNMNGIKDKSKKNSKRWCRDEARLLYESKGKQK
jgi:hypothetical protein